jgi:hypothetical protein
MLRIERRVARETCEVVNGIGYRTTCSLPFLCSKHILNELKSVQNINFTPFEPSFKNITQSQAPGPIHERTWGNSQTMLLKSLGLCFQEQTRRTKYDTTLF